LDKSSELQLLLARQPIFDLNTEVVAYELLFREFDPDQADVLDGDRATSAVLINALTNLDLQQLVGSGQAYVNFTANLLDVDIPLEPLGLSPNSVNEIYLSVIEWQSYLGDDLGLL
jgi:c-di-GMP-related signal transduction protein